ncbi:MAG: hypothetical protein J6Y91_02250 [Alphaproteobacteria bacterium]|nr:hypothetical protein [Alphaproteobacteria bacterium]
MSVKCVAAIDLGTNSCRLKITDLNGTQLYRDSVVTKLGEGLIGTGEFSDEAIERGLSCLCAFAEKMKDYAVGDYRAIATAACRKAVNGEQFIRSVEELSSIKMDIISAREEAVLNLKGARLNADPNMPYVFVYDLGGGSTELTLATNENEPKIIYTLSIPWGARTAAEAFDLLEYDESKAAALRAEIKKYTQEFLINSEFDMYRKQCSFIATSSTPLRLMSMIAETGVYKRENADGMTQTTKRIDAQIDKIFHSSFEKMAVNPYIGENRAPIFIAACVIFKMVYDELQLDLITASLKGAMEAIIEDLIHKWQHS